MLLAHREGVVRGLRRDRDETRAQLLDLGQNLLIGMELQIAVGAPLTTVECDDDRPLLEKPRERDLASQSIGQRERRSFLTHLQRVLLYARRNESVDMLTNLVNDLGRSLSRELGIELSNLLLKRGVLF